jgi:hypothetical protein
MEIDTSHGAFTICHHHWHANDGDRDGKDVGSGFHPARKFMLTIFGLGNSLHVDIFICSAAVVWVNPKSLF